MINLYNPASIQATLHCLTGCAIGEITGMIIGAAFNLHNLLQVFLSVILAFLFGYSLTMIPLIRQKISVKKAITIALAADTVSIIVMEIVDNGFVAAVPGALNAGLTDILFWASLGLSLVLAFIIAVPVNGWMINRGKGHAVAHKFHHH